MPMRSTSMDESVIPAGEETPVDHSVMVNRTGTVKAA
ncbi:hypothetical protein STIAU_4425 [Stigmatella aurantiaca DW4/3-1]|uniref:Uncharacterized protein n=1 Tax=Stigmatella aurantiaca (strain DW4/3-1) TaxID=378806 RepID=Q08WV7_STIAD|nr:hypothetical protein STIAU_4425 [Stigmatella aurantiaca DW4/3-1]